MNVIFEFIFSVLKQKNVNTGINSGPPTLNMMLSNPGQPNLALGGK